MNTWLNCLSTRNASKGISLSPSPATGFGDGQNLELQHKQQTTHCVLLVAGEKHLSVVLADRQERPKILPSPLGSQKHSTPHSGCFTALFLSIYITVPICYTAQVSQSHRHKQQGQNTTTRGEQQLGKAWSVLSSLSATCLHTEQWDAKPKRKAWQEERQLSNGIWCFYLHFLVLRLLPDIPSQNWSPELQTCLVFSPCRDPGTADHYRIPSKSWKSSATTAWQHQASVVRWCHKAAHLHWCQRDDEPGLLPHQRPINTRQVSAGKLWLPSALNQSSNKINTEGDHTDPLESFGFSNTLNLVVTPHFWHKIRD